MQMSQAKLEIRKTKQREQVWNDFEIRNHKNKTPGTSLERFVEIKIVVLMFIPEKKVIALLVFPNL